MKVLFTSGLVSQIKTPSSSRSLTIAMSSIVIVSISGSGGRAPLPVLSFSQAGMLVFLSCSLIGHRILAIPLGPILNEKIISTISPINSSPVLTSQSWGYRWQVGLPLLETLRGILPRLLANHHLQIFLALQTRYLASRGTIDKFVIGTSSTQIPCWHCTYRAFLDAQSVVFGRRVLEVASQLRFWIPFLMQESGV